MAVAAERQRNIADLRDFSDSEPEIVVFGALQCDIEGASFFENLAADDDGGGGEIIFHYQPFPFDGQRYRWWSQYLWAVVGTGDG